MKFKAWIQAIRLRTLPLALASIAMGSFLAAFDNFFSLRVLILSSLTTVFLQVLSNLANDYGDYLHGADSAHRTGPSRAVSSGAITASEIKTGIIITSLAALISGLWLIIGLLKLNAVYFMVFLAAGVLAILAAIGYTMGSRPYGYAGLGDLFVFIFFGLVGVGGTYFLYAGTFKPLDLLPAMSTGFFAVAVLNINNIRDIESDKQAGKKSIPVRIGNKAALTYHWLLLLAGWVAALLYNLLDYRGPYQFLFLLSTPLLIINGNQVSAYSGTEKLDLCLRRMAITTLVFVLTFGIGLLLAK